MQQTFCDLLYYVCILFFGVYSALKLACGSFTRKHRNLFILLCPALLIVQGILLELLGIEWVWRLYPLIVHVPIVLAFILFLYVKWDTALLAVIISYSLCQLMRWIGLVINILCETSVIALMIHLSLCLILFFLLDRYCMHPIHAALCRSGKSRHIFGALPILYYIYDYFMLYTQRYFAEVMAFQELLPTAMLLFFILFIIIFQQESEKHKQTEQQRFMLEMLLDHAKSEINGLRIVKEQTAIYRHDMHHHLCMISSLLAAGQPEQAACYIRRTTGEIESIVPHRYCENDTVNLLLGSFQEKANFKGISMSIKAALPAQLSLNDTELCVILSNALENALNATIQLPESAHREIGVFLENSQNKLLIEIRNPYAGSVTFQNGVPVAKAQEQHYGCRSILSVVERRNGICNFEANEGLFLLQIAIPLV